VILHRLVLCTPTHYNKLSICFVAFFGVFPVCTLLELLCSMVGNDALLKNCMGNDVREDFFKVFNRSGALLQVCCFIAGESKMGGTLSSWDYIKIGSIRSVAECPKQ